MSIECYVSDPIFPIYPSRVQLLPAIGQYEADEERLYEALRASPVPLESPLVVEDVGMEFDPTATREWIEAFDSALRRSPDCE